MRLPGFPRRAVEVDVAVVGSGLPALAAALELSRRGSRVAVVGARPEDRSRGLGLALLGPGRPYARVVRALGRAEARLVWAAGCENHLRLRALVEEAGRGCGYAARGSFLLAVRRSEAEELAESEDMLRDDGFPGEFLDHYMLETRFDLSGFPGAYWAAEDAEVDAGLLASLLGERTRDAGVAFPAGAVQAIAPDASFVSVDTEAGRIRAASALVATDGAAAALVPALRPLLRPAAGICLRTRLLGGAVVPTAVRTADGRFAWQAADGSVLLCGIGAAEGGEGSLEAFATRLPVEAASARAREDEAEVSVDGLPLVGRLPGPPLAVACGFGALSPGFAFAAARWAADALLSGADPTPAPLRATRRPGLV